jgi:uncharacterized protein (TIGR00255 family)
MIKSMTGFGSCSSKDNKQNYTVDIKTTNAKQFDFNLKIPSEFKDRENEIRKIANLFLERGKIECTISIQKNTTTNSHCINHTLVKTYFEELKQIATDVLISIPDAEILSIAMKMPDIMEVTDGKTSDEEWLILKNTIEEACRLTNLCRENEGKTLASDFNLHITNILSYLNEIEPYESERINAIKTRLQKALKEHGIQNTDFDANRFEQELIFYIEKIDFTEEKVRLVKHCDYFMQTMKDDTSNGKKLSFISQEIGREINTLGSKSLEVNIQQKVVQMKDELEKIKEQLANIL